MVLPMPSPYKHKITGVYWLKQRVPARLAATAKGKSVTVTVDEVPSVVRLGEYLKVSLRTKDMAEAKRRGNDAQSQFDLIWQSLTDAPARLTHRQIVALAGEIYRMFKAAEDDPGDAASWSKAMQANTRVLAGDTLYIGREYGMEKRFGPFVDLVLGKHTLKHFTMLVELKLPGTALFSSRRNRSGAWKLSTDLYDAVSQILEQKASWQVRSAMSAVTRDGNRIAQMAADPKALLVIGDDVAFQAGNERDTQLKLRTFELFRRDTRNVEIVTFSELYERASFIVAKSQ